MSHAEVRAAILAAHPSNVVRHADPEHARKAEQERTRRAGRAALAEMDAETVRKRERNERFNHGIVRTR